MSKAISFGFRKPKPAASAKAAPPRPPQSKKSHKELLRANESDNEDEEAPQHESVTGFSSGGAILSKPVQEKEVKTIQNAGNGDWRTRGRKNLLPEEVQAAQNGDVVMVERDEVSKDSGLQYATKTPEESDANGAANGADPSAAPEEPAKPLTEDEIAMAALLGDKPKSNAIIAAQGNARLSGQDETADFREDVATRPDSSTLEEYAAMPVEEFGMAMLRGMGQKRKAAGQTINLEGDKDDNPRKVRKQEGFLGIGAKAAPGADVELGAWGKAQMRKNNKGEGFFTPLMRENKETGERITEEEFQKRIKKSKNPKPEEDWRERRDRNLEKSGRNGESKRNGDQKYITDGGDHESSRASSSSRRHRDERDDDRHRSRQQRDDREYDSSRSKRDRSRSRDRRRRDDDDYDAKARDKDRDRDRYRDDSRYDSSSSHKSRHRERDRDRDRDRDRR